MQERYEQAIKETFKYLDDYIEECSKKEPIKLLSSLGIDKPYIIKTQMELRGFTVRVDYYSCRYEALIVYPKEFYLPVHIWRNKYVY